MNDVIKWKPLTEICFVVKTLVMGMLAKELNECQDGRRMSGRRMVGKNYTIVMGVSATDCGL